MAYRGGTVIFFWQKVATGSILGLGFMLPVALLVSFSKNAVSLNDILSGISINTP